MDTRSRTEQRDIINWIAGVLLEIGGDVTYAERYAAAVQHGRGKNMNFDFQIAYDCETNKAWNVWVDEDKAVVIKGGVEEKYTYVFKSPP